MSTSIALDRSNTSFVMMLTEYLKSIKPKSEYSFLKYYQNLVRVYMNDVSIDSRGLLVDHEMGLGKSILAVAVAIDMIAERQPIILLTKSLLQNMRMSIHKYVTMRAAVEPEWPLGRLSGSVLDSWIDENFSFVSMNASNMIQQVGNVVNAESDVTIMDAKIGELLQLPSLDGKLMIVDEAHNLFRAITNGSKNGRGLYDVVMKSNNLKILFLTGTPIANDPFELVPCFNMLGSTKGVPILPEDYREFKKLYVDDDGRIKNREKLQNRLFGLVSAVSHSGIAVNERSEFPERLPLQVQPVNMTHAQYVDYQLAREKEKEEGKRPGGKKATAQSLVKPKSRAASSYRVRSRQLSNFDPGNAKSLEEIDDPESVKYIAIENNLNKHRGQLGVVYSQFVGLGGLGPLQKYLEKRGWSKIGEDDTAEHTDNAKTTGGSENIMQNRRLRSSASLPTAMEYIDMITRTGGMSSDTAVGSDALNYNRRLSDDIDISSAFTAMQEEHDMYIGNNTKEGTRKYAIISGDVDVDTRTRIQNLFNSAENMHGELCELLMISSTGAEGLDLKRVRHIHIMEPYWNWGRIEQIISRGVRNNSHIDLPAEEKNVQSYIYLSVPPESEKTTNGTYDLTTDVELYEDALKNRVSIDSFIDAIKEVSIECVVIGGSHCRVCTPTGDRLYSNDPAKDIRTGDPCTRVQEESINVSEVNVLIDGAPYVYYYSQYDKSPYGVRVYEFDTKISAYKVVKESDSRFSAIIDAIENPKKTSVNNDHTEPEV